MKYFFLFLLCSMLVVSAAKASDQSPQVLKTAQQQIRAEFARLDSGLKKAAGELGKTGLTGDAVRRVLAATCSDFSYAVDCCTIDSKGRMVTVEPVRYRAFEGKDISDQEQVRQMLKTHRPVLSSVFRSVEGYEALDVEYPLFNQEGNFIGSISILLKPEKFLGDIIRPIVKGLPMDIWVMEIGGRILYDVDSSQLGLNLFNSSLYQPYEQLVQLGHEIAKTEQGIGAYRFKAYPTNRLATKITYWQSVSLYETPWRLVAIHLEPETKAEKD